MAEESGYFQAFVRLRSHTTGEWLAPPELRPRLVEDAEREGSNLTEVVVRILSDRYGVAFHPNGRRTAPAGDAEELNLRLPRPLYRAIKRRAATSADDRSVQDEIRAALTDHYGLTLPAAV